MMMADAFQNFNDLGKKMFLDSGGKISNFSPQDTDKLNTLFKPIFAEWVEYAKARGVPAENALDDLYNILVDLGVEKPFAR